MEDDSMEINYLANGDACNVSGSSFILDRERHPESSRPSVYLESNVLIRILAWHPHVQDIVQTNIPKLTISARKSHVGDSSAAEVEGRLTSAAVGASGTQIGDHNSCGR